MNNIPYVCSKCGAVESFNPGSCPLCGAKFVYNTGEEPDMFEELKAWAEKWKVPYSACEREGWKEISFMSITYDDAAMSYNTETGEFTWYGGD